MQIIYNRVALLNVTGIAMYSIEIEHLSKTYRKGFWGIKVAAVVDISFSVKKNAVTGFVGPNGAGKTTTIKTITGLVKPSKGNVKVNGVDVSSHTARRGVAYLSEQPCFYGHLTVAESLEFAAKLLGMKAGVIKNEIHRVLDIVELSHKAKSKVKEMSKGMQQRLNMAQALLGNPGLMILDEPMSGMDPPGRRLFRNIFKEMAAKGTTVFFSTHVLEDIESVCDEVVVLSKGRLAYSGSVSDLLAKGHIGTEIEIVSSENSIKDILVQHGCSIESETGSSCTVVVPSAVNAAEILKLLGEKNIYPSQVVNRSSSMEDLLYGKSRGEHE